ncbi:hypothetical protein [Leuconostoc lactis]|uniref:hypothetical protein n=1 Tax=Leuconostoc lactis TaxID=1246 RepID=UPI00351E105D
MVVKNKPGILVKVLLLLLIFWGLYTPVANIVGPTVTSLSFVLIDILLFIYLIFSNVKINDVFQKSGVLKLIVAIFLASVYVGFRAAFSGNDTRLFQNLQIIVQIFYFFEILLLMYYKIGYSKYEVMATFLNVVFIQGIIAVLMLVIPSFHNVALNLYYAGSAENIFISAKRIYGISSEYTFTTPVLNGIFGVIAVFLSIKKAKVYLTYVPIILMLVLLNGRTGLIVFCIGAIIVILKNTRRFGHIIGLLLISGIGVYSVFYLLSIFSPNTYGWILSFFSDTSNLFQGQATGNYSHLSMQFPEQNIVFGYGYRIYNLNSIVTGITTYQRSDIGYANDLFLGGIVYLLLLYIPIFYYILSSDKRSKKFQQTGLPLVLALTLIIADYKGETMRNGNLLLGIITLATLIRLPEDGE